MQKTVPLTSKAEIIAKFAADLTWEDIPEAVRARAKLQILDALGTGLASHAYPFAAKALEGIAALGGAGDCSVLGTSLRLSARDAAMANGLLMHGLYLGGVFTAIGAGLPAGITALVVGMQPLLTALGAGWLLGERVIGRQWLGLALGFSGVAMVVAGQGSAAGFDAPLGAMLIPALLALAGITAGTLYQKRFCPRFDLRTGSVIQFIPTFVITALAAWATETMAVEWSGEFVFALLWLVIVLSFGAITLLNLLIRSGNAVNVASLFYLTPPTTAVMAWLLFDERLAPLALAGMAVAVAGVWLARAR